MNPEPNWTEVGPDLMAALKTIAGYPHADNAGLPIGRARQIARAAIAKAERSADGDGWIAFLRSRFTPNWVLARRSPRIIARYGESVRCITREDNAKARADYLNGETP